MEKKKMTIWPGEFSLDNMGFASGMDRNPSPGGPARAKGQMMCDPDEDDWDFSPYERSGRTRYDTSTLVDHSGLIADDCGRSEFISDGFMLGTVGSLIADRGTGKTFLALQMAIRTAAGLGNHGPRGVLYLAARDPLLLIEERVRAISQAFQLDEKQMADAVMNFKVWCLLGQCPDLPEWTGEAWPLAEAICGISEMYRGDPLQLVIFDDLCGFSFRDVNDEAAMATTIAVMERICNQIGCSCLFLHQASRRGALTGWIEQVPMARGSSVLSDLVRYQEYMRPMSQAEAESLGEADYKGRIMKSIAEAGELGLYVRWGIGKQNYGSPAPEKWLKRAKGGVLLPAHLGRFPKKI